MMAPLSNSLVRGGMCAPCKSGSDGGNLEGNSPAAGLRPESMTRRTFALSVVASSIALAEGGRASNGAIHERLVEAIPEEDTHAVFSNPDMGWCVYENYAVDQNPHGSSTLLTCPNENFPGVDYAALLFSWYDIEKKEGVYDFSKVDYAYDYWKRRGKKLQLHMSTESWLWWSEKNPPAGKGPPDYVVNRLPPSQREMRRSAGIPYVELDARNPYYRARLEAFLHKVAEHFSADRAVELVDLRGFGVWGEWHNGYIFENLADIPIEYKEPLLEKRRKNLKGIIDIWSEAFKHNYLALSFSYDPDGPKEYYSGPVNRFVPACTKHYEGYLRFSAFDYAMTKSNITLRRDGCGGAIHSNERLFNERAFNTLVKGPMMSEFFGGYTVNFKTGEEKYVRWMVNDALSIHPNYIALMGWQSLDALAFLRGQPDLIRHGMTHMGYRLLPKKVIYSRTVGAGMVINIKTIWVNRGVGRAMRNHQFHVGLRDVRGALVLESCIGKLPTSRWIAGQEYKASSRLSIGNTMAGQYTLLIALSDGVSGQRINLPVKGGHSGWYPVGPLEIR